MAPNKSYGGSSSAFPMTVFAHMAAVAMTVMMLVWLFHFREGVAFKSDVKAKIFNLHPMLMTLGFVLLSGEAAMAYRGIPTTRKNQKLLHLILHFLALVAGIIGIYAVFKFHAELNIPDMYTLHSWLGMSTISIFGLQWLFSFFTFWYPRAQHSTRARIAPWHAIFGVLIFFMVILTAITGLVERFIFLSLRQNQEALVVNFTGLLIFFFGASVILSVLLQRSYN